MSKKQIKLLEDQINYHRRAYYEKNAEISDAAFDLLVDELTKLDPENKAITSVGTPVENNEWKKIKHSAPMGSLNKASNISELNDWIDQYVGKNTELFFIDKIDGLSVLLNYENGTLISCGSRGNGEIGDDIYRNVIKMKGVKKYLRVPFSGNIRGEIVLKKKDLEAHFPEQRNGRNISSGVSRRLDGIGCEHLSVLFYYVLGNVDLETEEDQMNYLTNELRLPVPKWSTSKGGNHKEYINELYELYQRRIRDSLEYEIDGIVCSINNLTEQLDHGISNNRRKGSIALKFPSDAKETVLRDVVWQIGNSGRCTPVGLFDPIVLAGAQIEKASLHNIQRIKDIGIKIGDKIIVSRRNDVIPYIEAKIDGDENNEDIVIPEFCPICDGDLERSGEYLICISSDQCPAQVKGRILNWINILGLLEWGEELVSKLIDASLVNSVSDLYKLKVEDIAGLERMGKKSAEKAFNILHSNKKLSLQVLLGGLSIPTAAVSTFEMLIDAGYNSLEKILAITEEELNKVRGIGAVKAGLIYEGLKQNKEEINKIMNNGIEIKEQETAGKLYGKSFVVTGKTITKRADLKIIIENHGGIFKNSVGSNVDFLVSADVTSGSIKMQKAEALGVKLLSEEELFEMIGE